MPHTLSELTGPVYGHDAIQEGDNDLTKQHKGEPLGERIIVHGHVLDEDKRPVPDTLVEIWQANACGRYVHNVDQHPAPLDPNFTGAGRTVTDKNGYYRFITVKPGAYPWGNHHNAWRPNHIHFSVFGHSFLSRLVTQMYFPGDSLFPFDPIFNSVTDEKARERMISSFDLENTIPDWALCFRFDIVLRGREADPNTYGKTLAHDPEKWEPVFGQDHAQKENIMSDITPSQTVGPFFAYGLAPHNRCDWKPSDIYDWKETDRRQFGHAGRDRHEHPHRGPRARRRRQADQRRHDRDLAGRRARPLRPCARREAAPERQVQGLRPLGHRQGRRLQSSTPSSPGRCRAPTANRRRRISWSASSRAACCGRSIRGSISPTRRQTPPIRSWRWCRPIAAPPSLPTNRPAADLPVYRFDIRVQGDNETVFFDI